MKHMFRGLIECVTTKLTSSLIMGTGVYDGGQKLLATSIDNDGDEEEGSANRVSASLSDGWRADYDDEIMVVLMVKSNKSKMQIDQLCTAYQNQN